MRRNRVRLLATALAVTLSASCVAPATAAALPSPGDAVGALSSALGSGASALSDALGSTSGKVVSGLNSGGQLLSGAAGKAAKAGCWLIGTFGRKALGSACNGAVKAVQTVGGLVGKAKSKGAKGTAGAVASTVAKAAAGAGVATGILAGLGYGIGYLDGQLEQDLTSGPNGALGLADLESGPFGSVYAIASGVAVLIAMGLFLLSVAEAAVVGSGRMMSRSTFVGLPKATVGVLAAPVLVVLVGTALDGIAGGLVLAAQGHVHQWFGDLGGGGVAHVTDWVLSGIGDLVLLPALLVAWVELALRKLLLAAILVFLAISMAGETHHRFAHWGPVVRRLIIGLLFVKLLVALVVLLGSAVPDITSNWLLHLLGGGILIGIAAYSPFFILRHAPMTAELAGGGAGSHREEFAQHGPLALDSAGMAQYIADSRSSDVATREETRREETRETRTAETGEGDAGVGGGKQAGGGQPGKRGEDGGDEKARGTTPAQPPKRDGGDADARPGDGGTPAETPPPQQAGRPASGVDGQRTDAPPPEGGGEVIQLGESRSGGPAVERGDGTPEAPESAGGDAPSAPPSPPGDATDISDERGRSND